MQIYSTPKAKSFPLKLPLTAIQHFNSLQNHRILVFNQQKDPIKTF